MTTNRCGLDTGYLYFNLATLDMNRDRQQPTPNTKQHILSCRFGCVCFIFSDTFLNVIVLVGPYVHSSPIRFAYRTNFKISTRTRTILHAQHTDSIPETNGCAVTKCIEKVISIET